MFGYQIFGARWPTTRFALDAPRPRPDLWRIGKWNRSCRTEFFRSYPELGTRLFQGIFEGLVPRVSVMAGVARNPLEDVATLHLADLEVHQRVFHGRRRGRRRVRG